MDHTQQLHGASRDTLIEICRALRISHHTGTHLANLQTMRQRIVDRVNSSPPGTFVHNWAYCMLNGAPYLTPSQLTPAPAPPLEYVQRTRGRPRKNPLPIVAPGVVPGSVPRNLDGTPTQRSVATITRLPPESQSSYSAFGPGVASTSAAAAQAAEQAAAETAALTADPTSSDVPPAKPYWFNSIAAREGKIVKHWTKPDPSILAHHYQPSWIAHDSYRHLVCIFKNVEWDHGVIVNLLKWTIDTSTGDQATPMAMPKGITPYKNVANAIDRMLRRQPRSQFHFDIQLGGLLNVRITTQQGAQTKEWSMAEEQIHKRFQRSVKTRSLDHDVSTWMSETESDINTLMQGSGDGTEILHLIRLSVGIRMTPQWGAGRVVLVDPKLWPTIISPECEEDCFFRVMDEIIKRGGLNWRAGQSVATVKQTAQIPGSMPVSRIPDVMQFYYPPVQIRLHRISTKSTFGAFDAWTDYPKTKGALTRWHIGIVAGHFFFIDTPAASRAGQYDTGGVPSIYIAGPNGPTLHTLSQSDFEVTLSAEGSTADLENKLQTYGEVSAALYTNKKLARAPPPSVEGAVSPISDRKGSDGGACAISDLSIGARIELSRRSDAEKVIKERARTSTPAHEVRSGEEYMTAAHIRALLSETKTCPACKVTLGEENWSIDRIHNGHGHIVGNVRICCQRCNISRKTTDMATYDAYNTANRQVYFWDCETYPVRCSSDSPIYQRGASLVQMATGAETEVSEHPQAPEWAGSHHLYSVGYVRRLPRTAGETEEQWGERHMQTCTVIYGDDAYSQFEGFLIELAGTIQARIDRLMLREKTNYAEYCARTHTTPSPHHMEETLRKLINANRAVFYAHNGANYDIQFIWKSRNIPFKSVIEHHGIISLEAFGGLVHFLDTMKITGPASLKSLCLNYLVPLRYGKTEFPHRFATPERLHYIGKVPSSEYWGSDGIPEEWQDPSLVFDFKAVSDRYQKLDCVALLLLWQRVRDTLRGFSGMDVEDYMTVPGLAMNYVMARTPPVVIRDGVSEGGIYVCTDAPVDHFIRRSIQGGRVCCQKGEFESKSYSAIHAALDRLKKPDDAVAPLTDDQALPKEYNAVIDRLERLDLEEGKFKVPVTPERSAERQTLMQRLTVLKQRMAERNAELIAVYRETTDYMTDLDATSLYPSAMARFPYPTGKPFWALAATGPVGENVVTTERVQAALNNQDESFYLGIIDCDLHYPSVAAGASITCPVLAERESSGAARHTKGDAKGRLLYTFAPKTHLVKTSVDLIQAVRYNGAVITQVHAALLWPTRDFVFKAPIEALFAERQKAKATGNVSLDCLAKLMLNSSYGKLSQRLIRTTTEIVGDAPLLRGIVGSPADSAPSPTPSDSSAASPTEQPDTPETPAMLKLDKLYQAGRAHHLTVLANGQAMVEADKERVRIKDPAHLSAFILAYSKVIMNRAIAAFDGFKDWESTFYYTDTDSIQVRADTIQRILKTAPELIGKDLGQLKDDISEVAGGKIIRAVFVRPKLYADEIIGLRGSKYAGIESVHLAWHRRAKGVPKAITEEWSMSDYSSMLKGQTISVNTRQFLKSFGDASRSGVVTEHRSKIINKVAWDGRAYDPSSNRYIPHGTAGSSAPVIPLLVNPTPSTKHSVAHTWEKTPEGLWIPSTTAPPLFPSPEQRAGLVEVYDHALISIKNRNMQRI